MYSNAEKIQAFSLLSLVEIWYFVLLYVPLSPVNGFQASTKAWIYGNPV